MGHGDLRAGSVFDSLDRELKEGAEAQGLPKGDRQCTHFKEESDGRPYDGELYLKGLQRTKGSLTGEVN
jgi:hypothetical protein